MNIEIDVILKLIVCSSNSKYWKGDFIKYLGTYISKYLGTLIGSIQLIIYVNIVNC